jgi:hypothetical protein
LDDVDATVTVWRDVLLAGTATAEVRGRLKTGVQRSIVHRGQRRCRGRPR